MSYFEIEMEKALRLKNAKPGKKVFGSALKYAERKKAFDDMSRKAVLLRGIHTCLQAQMEFMDELKKIDPALVASFFEDNQSL